MTPAARTERRQASSSRISPAAPRPSTRDRVLDPLRMSRTDFLRKDPLAGDVATEHRGRKGGCPSVTVSAACLGLGRSVPRCPTWRPIQRSSFEPVGQKEPILRQQTLTQMWSLQFSPDPRIRGWAGIFLHDFDGRRVVGHDRNLPGFAFALILAGGQVASSCSPTRRPCSARICSPRRAFARGLVCRRRAPGCRALMCLSARIRRRVSKPSSYDLGQLKQALSSRLRHRSARCTPSFANARHRTVGRPDGPDGHHRRRPRPHADPSAGLGI
jgi:hypothetical protein